MSKEEVNRIIAEHVMGWRLSSAAPYVEAGRWINADGKWALNKDGSWKPSENPAQFTEAFAKAPSHKQSEAIELWAEDAGYFHLEEDGANEGIIAWQLTPIEDKARALAEALSANKE